MIDEEVIEKTEEKQVETSSETALVTGVKKLDVEALELINQVIEETDPDKTKDLTYLFNLNQKKKTMVRINKLNDLYDIITEQAITRLTERPDNFSNQEILQGMKVVQDALERGQKQLEDQQEQPLIQINQQTNEVNLGPENMPRESRDRIRGAVMDFLSSIGAAQNATKTDEVIDATVEEKKDGN